MSCVGNEDFQDFNKLPSSALGAPLMVAILAIGIAIGSLVFSGSAMAQKYNEDPVVCTGECKKTAKSGADAIGATNMLFTNTVMTRLAKLAALRVSLGETSSQLTNMNIPVGQVSEGYQRKSLDTEHADSSLAFDGTGFSSGDEAIRKAVWVRGYNSIADQGSRTDGSGAAVAGYDSVTWGGGFGMDGMITDKSRVGISFNFARTVVDGDGLSGLVDTPLSESDILSKQVAVYGDYSSDMIGGTSVRPYYLVGMFAYGSSAVNATRITGASLNTAATSDYDTHQVTAHVGGGVPLVKGKHVFTPNAAFQYTHVWNEDYTENGAGTLNMVVEPEDTDIALIIVGLDYMSSYSVNDGVLTPQMRASVSYDLASDRADSVSRFISQSVTFSSQGAEVDELAGSVGAGLTYSTPSGKWDLSADYDADLKDDYIAHTSRLEARLNF